MKRERRRAGLTQQQVADALGIKKARYGDWERETREINLRDAIRVAQLFGCTLDELAGLTSPNSDAQQGGYSRISESLSPDERALISDYRLSDDRGRHSIAEAADRERRATSGGEALSHPRPRRAA